MIDMQLIERLLQRPIAFHRCFAELAGGATNGLFLSQLYYWSTRTNDEEGWFYKTCEEWHRETALIRYEQESARKKLKGLGLLEELKQGVPCKLYYRLNRSKLFELLANKDADIAKQECRYQQTRMSISTNKGADISKHTIYTENTTETKTENTHKSAREIFPTPVTVSNPEETESNPEIKNLPEVKVTQDGNLSLEQIEAPNKTQNPNQGNLPGVFDKPEQAKHRIIEDMKDLNVAANGAYVYPWENYGRSRNNFYDEQFAQWLYTTHLKRYTGFTKEGFKQNLNAVRNYLRKVHNDSDRREKVIDCWNEYIETFSAPEDALEAPVKPALESLLSQASPELRQIIINGSFDTSELEYMGQLLEVYKGMPNPSENVIYWLESEGKV